MYRTWKVETRGRGQGQLINQTNMLIYELETWCFFIFLAATHIWTNKQASSAKNRLTMDKMCWMWRQFMCPEDKEPYKSMWLWMWRTSYLDLYIGMLFKHIYQTSIIDIIYGIYVKNHSFFFLKKDFLLYLFFTKIIGCLRRFLKMSIKIISYLYMTISHKPNSCYSLCIRL